MRMATALASCALLAGASCGPVPVERAERICLERLGPPGGLRGTAGMGVGNDGFITKFDVELSASVYQGRDPSEVYDACVYRKSGQLPTRPLYDRADRRG